MKTNKKLKLNTKKVVILSTEQQDSVQGGIMYTQQRACYTDHGCPNTSKCVLELV